MNDQTIVEIGTQAVWVAVLVAAPALLATLAAGLVISIFQAATQINEQTLSFIPKVLAMTVAILFFGPWIIQTMMTFTISMFERIPTITQ
ncbi:MAG: flagellar biosynthesis protein FliQ [Oligoflexales bacterium]|nr:flagellar biosynthesis protein FliQ [Oligoflexales bacterium]